VLVALLISATTQHNYKNNDKDQQQQETRTANCTTKHS
jgi:hypothetical protein